MVEHPSTSRPTTGDRRLSQFALAKFLQLVAQNALIYGLFVLVIPRQESSLATSAFILTSILPSIVLSLPGGVIADITPNKLLILLTLMLRAIITILFLLSDLDLSSILLLSVCIWTVYQFYSPSESAAVPAIVQPQRYAAATSLLHAVSLLAQLLGAAFIAPVALKFLGEDGLFLLVTALLIGSMGAFAWIPELTPKGTARRSASGLSSMPLGLRTIRAHDTLARATVLRVVLDTASMALVVAIPSFVTDVLHTSPENAIYIVAPGAIGVVLGLLLAPLLARLTSVRAVLWTGFLVVAVAVVALAFLSDVARLLEGHSFESIRNMRGLFGLSSEIAATILLMPLAGLGISLVQVGARTAVYYFAPPGTFAQVFATQSAIGSLVTLIPTLLAGLALDHLHVQAVLILTAFVLMLCPVAVLLGPRLHDASPVQKREA